jgi:general nucleoside transport system permease protein
MDVDVSLAFFVTWLAGSIRLGGPLLLAATGEIYAECSGVVNVGIEGTILVGALASFLATYAAGDPLIGIVAAFLAGIASNLFLAWMYVSVQASQVVVGITYNVMMLGLSSYLYRTILGADATRATIPMLSGSSLPPLIAIPIAGPVLFAQPLMLYATLVLVGIAGYILFYRQFGLDLRAVGENPVAAAAAGIRVRRMRYYGVLIGGATAGLAGAYLMLCQIGIFRDDIVSGHGFIALAIVILGRWNPFVAAIAAFGFGAADALPISLQMLNLGVPPQALLALPYVIAILVMSGLFGRVAQPAALMTAFEGE